MAAAVSAAAAGTVASHTALTTTAAASGAEPPSGSLLWSNVSEAGLGLMFASSAVPLGASGDVLLVGPSASGAAAINRLQAATGEILWSLPLKGAGLSSAASLSVGAPFGDPKGPPVLVAWASGSESTTVIGVDVKTGDQRWNFSLPFDEMGRYTFTDGVFMGFGNPIPMTRHDVVLTAYSIGSGKTEDDGATLLLNVSVGISADSCGSHQIRPSCLAHVGCGWDSLGGECRAATWYSGVGSLIPVDETLVALVGTVDGDDSAAGSLYALNTSDGATLWTADNITATRTHVVRDV
eukprot:SAG31_NODE_12265_length_954_cov_1.010526_1_plen_294_part_01